MFTIKAGGATIQFPATNPATSNSYQVTGVSPNNPSMGPDNTSYVDNGTWLYIRPTAVYQGDDHDTQVLTSYGTKAQGTANGSFSRDVAVRIDGITGSDISYSYSADDGTTWIPASATVNSTGDTNLLLPGGYLAFDSANTPAIGNQFVVHPHRADITLQIGDNDHIAVNMVGKDIFGGYYNHPGDSFSGKTTPPITDPIDYPVRVDEGRANLFETLGDLIAALETNSQAGCQEALPKIEEAMKLVLTKAAEVGGRENRLITTQAAILMRQYSEEDNMSAIEDIDIYELTARLAQQQVAYNSVLKSSSMIMQMSLVNFL
jgi:flagellar hook-associated protein 3 FlgL